MAIMQAFLAMLVLAFGALAQSGGAEANWRPPGYGRPGYAAADNSDASARNPRAGIAASGPDEPVEQTSRHVTVPFDGQARAVAAAERSAAAAERQAASSQERIALDLAVLLLLVVLLVYTLRGAIAGRRSTENAGETLKQVTALAHGLLRSASAAEKALTQSREMFEAARRPLIAFETFSIQLLQDLDLTYADGEVAHQDRGVAFTGHVTNVGLVPAASSVTMINLQILPKDEPASWPAVCTEKLAATIAQNVRKETSSQVMTEDELRSVLSGERRAYLFARVDYINKLTGRSYRTSTGVRVHVSLNQANAATAGGKLAFSFENLPEFDDIS